MSDKCLVIAEAGVNHNGSVQTALELCDAAKDAGADVVKFQTWITEAIITKKVAQAEYQMKNTGREEAQYDMLKRLELPFHAFETIKKHCDEIGIVFSSTADDRKSLDFLIGLGIPFIKVGSGDIGNISYLRYIGSKGLPIILSTGMSTLSDVDLSVSALQQGGAKDITLLHCTTSYPCPMSDVNLRAMEVLRGRFGFPVGYSDHTVGDEVALAAVAMGACVIEKHFTLDRNMEGPDHAASTPPDEFKILVEKIREVESALGKGLKEPTDQEKKVMKVVRKRIVAAKPISVGEIFSEENITVKRNDTGAPAADWDRIIGKASNKSYESEEGIEL